MGGWQASLGVAEIYMKWSGKPGSVHVKLMKECPEPQGGYITMSMSQKIAVFEFFNQVLIEVNLLIWMILEYKMEKETDKMPLLYFYNGESVFLFFGSWLAL